MGAHRFKQKGEHRPPPMHRVTRDAMEADFDRVTAGYTVTHEGDRMIATTPGGLRFIVRYYYDSGFQLHPEPKPKEPVNDSPKLDP